MADQPSSNQEIDFETIDGGEKWDTMTAIDLKAKGQDPVVLPALIVTASHTENDMSYGSGAEARL